jgi:polyisoprenoid-binding protein YceI
VTDGSEARFNIFEELRGAPTDVIGSTDQVAGDVIVDFDNPQSSTVGTIVINARTLATDNVFRDQAIRSRILQSARDEYEFIEFVPSGIEGLPETVSEGDTFTFDITGDLTIRGVTREETFETSVTVTGPDQIEGSATTTVMYPDYGLSIPSAPGVANVSEEVTLEIDFTALQVEESA